MKFYDMLQLDPQIIKDMMGKSSVKKEKRKLATAMFLRSILIVLFAILFISALSSGLWKREHTYRLLPMELHGIIGPLGGFCLG